MEMIRVDIADEFPVIILCFEDGTLMLSPQGRFPVIFETVEGGVSSIFHSEGFDLKMGGEVGLYYYNMAYEYKQMPVLKAWLVQQNLINPLG